MKFYKVATEYFATYSFVDKGAWAHFSCQPFPCLLHRVCLNKYFAKYDDGVVQWLVSEIFWNFFEAIVFYFRFFFWISRKCWILVDNVILNVFDEFQCFIVTRKTPSYKVSLILLKFLKELRERVIVLYFL